MSNRTNYPSGSKWEDIIGYSRAVKIGNIVEVTGTVASDENGNTVGKNNPYEQTKYILQKIEKVLQQAGASLKDVIRTRMFVTEIRNWEEYGRAHGEFFAEIKPCTTMVEVSSLIGDEYLVEIEVSAVVNTNY
jgi:enamine deaminase RidA (YjgF/YER057c/UK114 family)